MDLIKKKNTKCNIKDSSLCHWLDKNGCEKCYVMELGDDEQADALKRWEITQSLLPDNVDDLHQSENCHFCAQDPQPRAYYGSVDLANPEPASMKGMFFGFGKKVRTQIGSLLPISISCCRRCRRAFLMTDVVRYLTPFVFLVVAILLSLIPPFYALLNSLGAYVSTIFVVAMFLIGIGVGKLFFISYVTKKGKAVRFNIFDIPILEKMKDKGWFVMENDSIVTKVMFSKNKFGPGKLKSIDIKEDE
jgi:hypothetical protein